VDGPFLDFSIICFAGEPLPPAPPRVWSPSFCDLLGRWCGGLRGCKGSIKPGRGDIRNSKVLPDLWRRRLEALRLRPPA